MKNKLFLLSLLTLSLGLCSTNSIQSNKFESKLNSPYKSILNYSSDMGIFKDLTKDEVVSYYSTLQDKKGIKGDELLTDLQTILKNNHKQISHATAWSSDWYYFTLLDRDYENDPLTQTEISTGKWKVDNVKVVPLYTEKTTFIKATHHMNREHVWPKSRGFKYATDTKEENKGSEQPYAATDMHNLRMGEEKNNQNGHSNYPYGIVASKEASSTTKITSIYSNTVTGYTGLNKDGITVYEPRDEDKGDIARMLFYMATRYHSYISSDTFEPSLKLVSSYKNDSEATSTILCISTKDTPATYGILDDLLKRNEADPVSDFEIHRNNLCYNIVQNNRNPYVDFPEWANVAFSNTNYGIDLNNEDGIDSTGISIKRTEKQYEIGSKLDLSNDEITFKKEDGTTSTINLSDPNLTISIKHNGSEETYSSDFTFSEAGDYEIIYKYTYEDKTYTSKYTITIAKPQTFFEKYSTYIYTGIAVIIVIIFIIISTTKSKNKKKKSNTKNKTNTKSKTTKTTKSTSNKK